MLLLCAKNNHLIMPQICKCCDSWAVAICGKLWLDWTIKIKFEKMNIHKVYLLSSQSICRTTTLVSFHTSLVTGNRLSQTRWSQYRLPYNIKLKAMLLFFLLVNFPPCITGISHDETGDRTNRQLNCYFNNLLRLAPKKHQSSALLALRGGILRWPVGSLTKWQ